MATIVCQGLQSCLESQLVESRALRLRLSSPKPHFSQSLELALKPFSLESNNTREVISDNKCQYEEVIKTQKANPRKDNHATSNNPELGNSCWGFLQDLSNTSRKEMEKEKEYVHPLVKRSSSLYLSERSLKLCTENLGSESGTDINENGLLSLSDSDKDLWSSLTREQEKPTNQLSGADKKVVVRNSVSRSCCFPPPLTTMSGSESLQVRPHREAGRLIIKAVKAPSRDTYFKAERSNGRLRLLCFVKDSAQDFDEENEESNNEEEEKEGEIENEMIDHEEEDEEDDGDDDDDDEEEKDEGFEEEEMEGNSLKAGVKMGMEDFQRAAAAAATTSSCSSGRCKEGGGHSELMEKKGLLNWNWVATS